MFCKLRVIYISDKDDKFSQFFLIQAGGANTHSALSIAMASIQEVLKNSDWATRKAACAALGDIASTGGALFSAFKSSSIRSLESCRFDKVGDAVRMHN